MDFLQYFRLAFNVLDPISNVLIAADMNTIACFPYNRRRLRTVIVSAVDIRISTGRNLFFVLCLFQLLRSFYSSIINHFGFHATKNTPTIIHWIIMNKKTTRRRWEKFWFQLGIFKRNELIFECSTFLFICKDFLKIPISVVRYTAE